MLSATRHFYACGTNEETDAQKCNFPKAAQLVSDRTGFRLTLKDTLDYQAVLPHFLLELIGATLVHKTIQISSVQVNKISSAHCFMHPSPKAKFL